MAATVFGTIGKFGITAETSVGLHATSLTVEATSEQLFVPNHIGQDIAVAIFNEGANLSLSGATIAAGKPGGLVAAVFATANTDMVTSNSTAVTKFYVTGNTLTRVAKDVEQGDVSAVGRVGITASSASASPT